MVTPRFERAVVRGATIFAEHLVCHAVMTNGCALPARSECRVMPTSLGTVKE
jgi:hypothetical protein